VVLSDEPRSSRRIADFAAGESRWLVAVRMVSRAWTCRDWPWVSTPRRRPPRSTSPRRWVASCACGAGARPRRSSSPRCHHCSRTRGHGGRARPRAAPGRGRRRRGRRCPRGLPDGRGAARGTPGSRCRRRVLRAGIGGGVRPRALRRRRVRYGRGCQRRQAEQQTSRGGAAGGSSGDASPTTYERLSLLRRELNGLVGAWHHLTGRPHGAIHAELRQASGGPVAAQAGAEELQARIDLVRAWALEHQAP